MARFVGRSTELAQLQALLRKRAASLVVLRGRRRIGKSRLAEEFGSGERFLSLTGLPPTPATTAQDQRNEFIRQLSTKYGVPLLRTEDWGDLFWLLASITQSGRVVILLDEISWMGSKDPNFLGKLKVVWDQQLSKNPELVLILCGSVSSWIEENILSSTGFLGRVSLDLVLRELPLNECRLFWPARIAAHEVLKVLAVTGGVPKYLEEIVPEETAEYNIRRLCFTASGLLVREFDQIFADLFGQRSMHYQHIVQTLANGPQDLNTICEQLKIEKGGAISHYLHHLEQAGFIHIDPTWNLKQRMASRLKRYRLSDNYIRFYLKYILPRREMILESIEGLDPLDALPGWATTLGLQFENLVLANKALLYKHLHIDPASVLQSGPFFQRPNKAQPGCQIDLLIQTRYRTLYACEIKCSEHPVGASVVEEMQEKLHRLRVPQRSSVRPVLLHVNGVSDGVRESGLFDHIVGLEELLEQ